MAVALGALVLEFLGRPVQVFGNSISESQANQACTGYRDCKAAGCKGWDFEFRCPNEILLPFEVGKTAPLFLLRCCCFGRFWDSGR